MGLVSAEFTDDYTRADSATLGADYADGYTGFASPRIGSNVVKPQANDSVICVASVLPVLQRSYFGWIQAQIVNTVPSGANDNLWLFMYMTAPPDLSGYAAKVDGSLTEIHLTRFDAGVESNISTSGGSTVSGDVVRLQFTPSRSGAKVQVFVNNVARITIANSVVDLPPGRFGLGLQTALVGLNRTNCDNLSLGFHTSEKPNSLRPAIFAPGLAR
jgi:hypothetical protein